MLVNVCRAASSGASLIYYLQPWPPVNHGFRASGLWRPLYHSLSEAAFPPIPRVCMYTPGYPTSTTLLPPRMLQTHKSFSY